MRKRYVARDMRKDVYEYIVSEHRPYLQDSLWCAWPYKEITAAEAKELIGRTLKRGEYVKRY